MNKKIEAGHRVAQRLLPAENSIDTAIIDNAALVIALVSARREAEQPCAVIQKALDEAQTTAARLNDARRSIVDTHTQILRVRTKIGLGEVDYGCGSPCLPSAEKRSPVKAVEAA